MLDALRWSMISVVYPSENMFYYTIKSTIIYYDQYKSTVCVLAHAKLTRPWNALHLKLRCAQRWIRQIYSNRSWCDDVRRLRSTLLTRDFSKQLPDVIRKLNEVFPTAGHPVFWKPYPWVKILTNYA